MSKVDHIVTLIFFCVANFVFYLMSLATFMLFPIAIVVVILSSVFICRFKLKYRDLFISHLGISCIMWTYVEMQDYKGLAAIGEAFIFYSAIVFIAAQTLVFFIYIVATNAYMSSKASKAGPDSVLMRSYIKTACDRAGYCVMALKDNDTDKLISCFSKYVLENGQEELIQQAKAAMELIDGKIRQYDLVDIVDSQHINEETGELDFYACYPKFVAKTKTNKKYSILFCYHCIWDKHNEYVGVGSIRVSDQQTGTQVVICDHSYPYDDR